MKAGSSYIRWGRTVCPDGSETLYRGKMLYLKGLYRDLLNHNVSTISWLQYDFSNSFLVSDTGVHREIIEQVFDTISICLKLDINLILTSLGS